MPAIKCPSCGHRHFQLVAACINCGSSLPAPMPAVPVYQEEEIPGAQPPASHIANDDVTAYERFLAESGRRTDRLHTPDKGVRMRTTPGTEQETGGGEKGVRVSNQGVRMRPTPDTEQGTGSGEDGVRVSNKGLRMQATPGVQQVAPAGGTPALRQLVVRQGDPRPALPQAWQKQRDLQVYEPYETSLDIVPPEAFSAFPGAASTKEELEKTIEPEWWKTDKLPWYFPKVRPQTSGMVVHIESKEEIIDYPDIFAAIATLLVGLIWVLVDVQQEKEHDRVVMTTVRVQAHDGTLKDARLRGNMRGADLSLGDRVSLWGTKRRGVLFIRRGFNHTTQGVVSTASLGLIVPALIVIVAFVGGIYFAPVWVPLVSHVFTSLLGPFLNLLHRHS